MSQSSAISLTREDENAIVKQHHHQLAVQRNNLRDQRQSIMLQEKGKYKNYPVLRTMLMHNLLQYGGLPLWHQYWNGLRDFLLARISKREFELLMHAVSQKSPHAMALHNELIATILSNITSESTVAENVHLLGHCHLDDQELSSLPANIRHHCMPIPPGCYEVSDNDAMTHRNDNGQGCVQGRAIASEPTQKMTKTKPTSQPIKSEEGSSMPAAEQKAVSSSLSSLSTKEDKKALKNSLSAQHHAVTAGAPQRTALLPPSTTVSTTAIQLPVKGISNSAPSSSSSKAGVTALTSPSSKLSQQTAPSKEAAAQTEQSSHTDPSVVRTTSNHTPAPPPPIPTPAPAPTPTPVAALPPLPVPPASTAAKRCIKHIPLPSQQPPSAPATKSKPDPPPSPVEKKTPPPAPPKIPRALATYMVESNAQSTLFSPPLNPYRRVPLTTTTSTASNNKTSAPKKKDNDSSNNGDADDSRGLKRPCPAAENDSRRVSPRISKECDHEVDAAKKKEGVRGKEDRSATVFFSKSTFRRMDADHKGRQEDGRRSVKTK